MAPPDDSQPALEPQAEPGETPVPADDPSVATDIPMAGSDDGPMPLLPEDFDSWGELPGGDEEFAAPEVEPAPDPAPEEAPEHPTRRASNRASTTGASADSDPGGDAPADSSDLLMKSLPVVRTAERSPWPDSEVALPVSGLEPALPGSVPFDRRGPVAVSVGLLCATLAAHAFAAWRRRAARWWPA